MAKSDALPSGYDGKELAFIKHKLLESYLQKLFLIVGSARRTQKSVKFCYVDSFAGPWKDESEQLETTSIAISLKVLASCKVALEKNGIATEIKAIYVEQEKTAYPRLASFLSNNTPEGIKSVPVFGDFVQLRDQILHEAGSDTFCFFFIDPKGYTEVGVNILRPLLSRPRSEFLINFMYDFANRVLSREAWQQQTQDLLGSDIDLQGLSPQAREEKALATYQANLRACMPVSQNTKYLPRSAHVRVLDRLRERPKYHLIYLTSHPRGIIEFMSISENVEIIQKQVRADTKRTAREMKSGNLELFASDAWVDHSAGHANANEVDEFWVSYLSGGEKRITQFEFADILETKGWFPSDLQLSLARLIAASKVANLDALAPRRTKPLHFQGDGERLALCPE